MKYDHLELARIIGEPRDPRKPYPDLVTAICQIGYADPDEYVYYFDVNQDTDYTSELMLEKLDQLVENKDVDTLSLIYS